MRLLIALTLIGCLGALTAFWAETARAEGGDIEVLEHSAKSQFPDGIEFNVSARSTSEIDDIRVYFRTLGNVKQSSYSAVEFEAGTSVDGTSLVKSKGQGNYFPPGTTMEYSFEIRDKAGAVLRTPEQEFVYLDTRFDWLTVTFGLITVYYYGEYAEARARTILDAASQALDRMKPVLGIEPTEPLRIVAYDNYRDMATALPFRSQATAEQLVTQGMAFSNLRVLLVEGSDATVKGTTSHEFVHLLVHEAAGPAITDVPAWLNEGLAEYGNIDPSGDYDDALRYGIYTRRLRPLWLQHTLGGNPDDVIIGYGQGRSVVYHMIDTYGPEKMAELMRVLQDTRHIDEALEQVYGFDQYGLDSEWRGTMGLEPLPPPEQLEVEISQPGARDFTEQTTSSEEKEEPDEGAEESQSPFVGNGEGQTQISGCAAPAKASASLFRGDPAMLLLLLVPLGLAGGRLFRPKGR